MKNANPIEAAEYAVQAKIDQEPAFAWWACQMLREEGRIIKATKSKHWLRTHKCGARAPKSVEGAKKIDEENGNTLWQGATNKGVEGAMIAFGFGDKFMKGSKLTIVFRCFIYIDNSLYFSLMNLRIIFYKSQFYLIYEF